LRERERERQGLEREV
jgi:hypothetical protein